MIRKTNYFEPYKANGRNVNLPGPWSGESGVYFIKRIGTKKPVYVGSSVSNLKKTIYRHFQTWSSDREQRYERTVYPKKGYLIKVLYMPPAQALELEKYFIKKIQPKDNPIKYNQLTIHEPRIKQIIKKVEAAPTAATDENLPF